MREVGQANLARMVRMHYSGVPGVLMKRLYLLLVLLALSCQSASEKVDDYNLTLPLIPAPEEVTTTSGTTTLSEACRIVAGKGTSDVAALFKNHLANQWRMNLAVQEESEDSLGSVLLFSLRADLSELGSEGYELVVQSESIQISAAHRAGLFYGMQTLSQLLRTSARRAGRALELPCLRIRDRPRFPWRGLMLDCSRTFQSLDYLHKTIDRMAYYKLNILQLHLTDDQGWRLEIDRYPELTLKGSRFADKYSEPESRQGFYTKQEMQELIQYALVRGITIVPEIEMPGHSLAALSCFPSLSCTGGPFEIFPFFKGPNVSEDIFCAGNDETLRFLENVLDEVMELFPSKYIHIGGDESPTKRWAECPKCKKRMQTENLNDVNELQSWFFQQIGDHVRNRGRRLVGWDEIVEGELDRESIVMSWRGIEGGISGARSGSQVVMSPVTHCYLDFSPIQIPLKKAYLYEPVPSELNFEQAELILGVQGNHWSHIDRNESRTDAMVFPRIVAIAERSWSPASQRDWPNFESRLDKHQPILDSFGITRWEPPVGEWADDALQGSPAKLVFDVSDRMDGSGRYAVYFRPKAWTGPKIAIRSVDLLADGVRLSLDDHAGIVGWDWSDPDYYLDVTGLEGGEEVSLRILLEAMDRKGGAGEVYLRRLGK